MPVLELTDGKGNLHPLAASVVHAVTLYPQEDDPRQRQLMAIITAELLTKHPEAVQDDARCSIALEVLEQVYSAPEPDEAWRRAFRYAANSWLAARILMLMLTAAIHHPEKSVSITKAVHVLADFVHGTPAWGGGTVQMAQQTAWKAWSQFKPVAHFEVVRQIWLQDKTEATGTDPEGWVSLVFDRLPDFLAMAEVIRHAAVERRILDFEVSWRPPPDLVLPSLDIEIPPLPDAMLEALDRYVPEHSKDAGVDEL